MLPDLQRNLEYKILQEGFGKFGRNTERTEMDHLGRKGAISKQPHYFMPIPTEKSPFQQKIVHFCRKPAHSVNFCSFGPYCHSLVPAEINPSPIDHVLYSVAVRIRHLSVN